jgi:type I restriction enzyme S subunit
VAPERSIFIVVKGAGVGKVFPGAAAAIGRDIVAFVPYKPLDRDFIYLALREQCKGLVGDARGHIPGLSRSILLNLWLDVPPLAEQQRIVEVVHKAEANFAATIERLGTARVSAADVRASIFLDAFTGTATEAWRQGQAGRSPLATSEELNSGSHIQPSNLIRGKYAISLGAPVESVPPAWSWSRLADLAELRTGHTPSRNEPDYWDGEIPWIGVTDARDNYGNVIQDTRQHITSSGLENSSAELLPIGTICLCRTAASIGYVVVTGVPMTTSQDFINWTCGEQVDKGWLLWLLIAEREILPKFGRGSTHKTIYMEDAVRLHVLLPPPEEQRRIVDYIDAGASHVDALVSDIDTAEAAAISSRDDTLAAALQGLLSTGHADDEDADVLLGHLEVEVEVTRAPATEQVAGAQDTATMSVGRLVQVVRDSITGVSPERLFASAGYRADSPDVFFIHIKEAVRLGVVRYDASTDQVIADET